MGWGRGRAGGFVGRDLTAGSISRNLGHLSWPMVLEGVLNAADQLADMFWAGHLPGGFRAVAGLGVAQTFNQFGMMARMGLDQATRAMVSRAVGAGNIPLANHIALQSFTLGGLYSLFVVVVGILLTDVLLRVIGASAEVQAQAAMYMRIQFVAVAAMGFRMMSGAALQAGGDAVTPLKATTFARVVHMVLTPFLLFGWWQFPHLGLAGAAIANLAGQLAGCLINYYVLFWGYSRLRLSLRGYRVDRPLLWRMVGLAAPASIIAMERAMSQLVLLRFVTPFGDIAVASYALTRRLEMLAHIGSMGLGQASGVLVSQNLGAGRPDRAKRTIGWALVYALVASVTLGSLLFLLSGLVAKIFTSQPDVVALTSTWLRIQAVVAVFMGLGQVFQQSYITAGDTVAPFFGTLFGVWGIEVPLAWALTQYTGLGPLGIGYAALIGMVARLIAYGLYFFTGRWLRVKVI